MTECKQALDFTNTYMFTLQSVISAYNSAYEVLTDRCIITLIKNEKCCDKEFSPKRQWQGLQSSKKKIKKWTAN